MAYILVLMYVSFVCVATYQYDVYAAVLYGTILSSLTYVVIAGPLVSTPPHIVVCGQGCSSFLDVEFLQQKLGALSVGRPQTSTNIVLNKNGV